MIETRDLTKHFGRHLAVDRLTLSLAGPGLVGLLGPNGAGKSTTLRMLTGALASSAGWARVGGVDVFDEPRKARACVGYLPEAGVAMPALTVGEVLRYAAELHGLRRDERLRRVGEVMAQVELAGHERRLVDTLPGGFRTRLGLAWALIHDPAVLVLDEPLQGLDPLNRRAVRAVIRQVAEHRLVLLSTHVLPEVASLCTRVVLLDRGRLLAEGPVADLAAQAGVESHVELVLDQPAEDVSARLAAVDVVERVERLPTGAYRLHGPEALEPAVATLAGVHGWKVRRLARHPPALEEVFAALMERT